MRFIMGRRAGFLTAAFAAGLISCGCFGAAARNAAPSPADPADACDAGGAAEVARGAVSRVIDGRDFVLDGGRVVHLAGLEVPLVPPPGAAAPPPGGRAAKAALEKLLAGARVELRRAEIETDRYGRLVAYAEALGAGSRVAVQAAMITAGFARVGADIASISCARELLRREAAARAARLGLWARSYYQPLHAADAAAILAQRGHFGLIEGRVVSVHTAGAIIYLNFGRHWSRDFAVRIWKRNSAKFAAAGIDPQQLAGRRVRVRGWIAERIGLGTAVEPWIEAVYPEQIEILDRK